MFWSEIQRSALTSATLHCKCMRIVVLEQLQSSVSFHSFNFCPLRRHQSCTGFTHVANTWFWSGDALCQDWACAPNRQRIHFSHQRSSSVIYNLAAFCYIFIMSPFICLFWAAQLQVACEGETTAQSALMGLHVRDASGGFCNFRCELCTCFHYLWNESCRVQ